MYSAVPSSQKKEQSMRRALAKFSCSILCLLLAGTIWFPTLAQDVPTPPQKPLFKPEELEAIVAPIALYPDSLLALADLSKSIRSVAPEATDAFAYGLPGFKYRGRPLAYYGAAKNHCGLYGLMSEAFAQDLAGYERSKGTVRFTPDKPLPAAVVRKMVRSRMADIDKAEDARKPSRAAKRSAVAKGAASRKVAAKKTAPRKTAGS